MTDFRPFRNTDPPALAELWCAQPPQRGVACRVTTAMLEESVYSKPYFDPRGLTVAVEGEEVVGFSHAGFGCDDAHRMERDLGVTCMLMTRPGGDEPALAAELIARSERYLRERGAKVLYGGGIRPVDPFYHGFYGGSELPGILESDTARLAAFEAAGYEPIDGVVVLQRDLSRFRPPVNRKLIQLRRTTEFVVTDDPPPASWWEACHACGQARLRVGLRPIGGGPTLAEVTFWDVEPLGSGWGRRLVGMLDLEVVADRRREGLATWLVGEAMRRLEVEGVQLVEAQTMQGDSPALALYEKLGFTPVDRGVVLRKSGG